MENIDLILMLIALTLGTQICRFIPLIIPNSLLTHPILQKLNKMLPLVIMLLLVLTSLNIPTTGEYTMLIAQIIALIGVLFSYKWFNNILLSVGLGILNINLLLWLLG